MLSYGTSMNISCPFHGTGLLFLYFLKYNREPIEVSRCFQGAMKETSAMKWVKSNLIFSYLFCYLCKYIIEDGLYNWKASYKMKLLIYFINTHGEFISCDADKIVFILLNTSRSFFFQFEACIIYCFHVYFFCLICFECIDCSLYTKNLFDWR